jgi:hypothetical protein
MLRASSLKDQLSVDLEPRLPSYSSEETSQLQQNLPPHFHEMYLTAHSPLSSNDASDLNWLFLCRYFVHCFPLYEPIQVPQDERNSIKTIGYLPKTLPFLAHVHSAHLHSENSIELSDSIAKGSVIWRPEIGIPQFHSEQDEEGEGEGEEGEGQDDEMEGQPSQEPPGEEVSQR